MTIDSSNPAVFYHEVQSASEFIADLYRVHALSLIRLALLLVGDQHSAEDVVQDAFLGLQRGLPRLREPAKALPYLRASVVNGCRSVQRARSRARRQNVQHTPPVWSAEAAAIASEDRRAVLAAVADLPGRAREVLAFRYYLDLPDREIAEILGISRSTVSSTASRALVTLARQLEERM
ncbi:MAG TPA: sigma-70 family RNA polymerase sigma factor [Streptosporangiaceae bacterium]